MESAPIAKPTYPHQDLKHLITTSQKNQCKTHGYVINMFQIGST